jgi:hypothetical protein
VGDTGNHVSEWWEEKTMRSPTLSDSAIARPETQNETTAWLDFMKEH